MHNKVPAGTTVDVSLSDIDVRAEGVPYELAVGRALFLWALDPIMLTRPDTGAILDANPAACRAMGLSVQEIRARGREGLRDQSDGRWVTALRQREHTGSFSGEVSMQRGDGTTFPAEISSAVFEVGGQKYAVLTFRDLTAQQALEQQLREAVKEASRLATMDSLTGLLNRRGFMTIGRTLEEGADREGVPLIVRTADVDGLKRVNDELGHAAGDEMLCDVATVLSKALRSADVVARLGGDEFGVILMGARAAVDAAAAVDRINQDLAAHDGVSERPVPLTVSVGVASGSPGSPFSLYGLLRSADEAMYRQKRQRQQ